MANRLLEATILETFIYIIAGWVVVATWQRFVENYAYNGLGMNREMPYHNFIVAVVISGVFIIVVTTASKIIQVDGNNIAGESQEFNPGLIPEGDLNQQGINKDEPSRQVNDVLKQIFSPGELTGGGEYDEETPLRKIRKRNTGSHIIKTSMSRSRRERKSRKQRDN